MAKDMGYEPTPFAQYITEYMNDCHPHVTAKVDRMTENEGAAFAYGLYAAYVHEWFKNITKNPHADLYAIWLAQTQGTDAQA